MRRMRVVTVALVGLALAVAAGVGLAAPGDVERPKCGDVVDLDLGYAGDVVTANVYVPEASCKRITYALHVIVDQGATPLVFTTRGDATLFEGETDVVTVSSSAIADDDAFVCAWVTTSFGGKNGLRRVVDRAPDADVLTCVTLQEGGAGGNFGYD